MPQPKATSSFADDLASVSSPGAGGGGGGSFADDLASVGSGDQKTGLRPPSTPRQAQPPSAGGMLRNFLTGVYQGGKAMVEHPVENAPAIGGMLGGAAAAIAMPEVSLPAMALGMASSTGGAALGSAVRQAGQEKPEPNPIMSGVTDTLEYGALPEAGGQLIAGLPALTRAGRAGVSRLGARGRNAELMGELSNPSGTAANVAGRNVQQDILSKKKQVMGDLQSEYGAHLGTPQKPSPLGKANLPGPPKASVSQVDTGAVDAGGQPILQSQTTMGPGEPGPSFRDLHDQRSDLLQQARGARDRQTQRELMQQVEATSKQMQDVASKNGLTKEASDYFTTANDYKLATRQFENKFVGRILNTPEESVADLFLQGRQPGVKPTGARDEAVMTNTQLMQRLKGIVPPATYSQLQDAVGGRLMANVTNASGDVSGVMLYGRLRKLQQAGVLNDLLPQGDKLLQVAQILTKDRGANAAQLPTNSMTARIVNKLLRKMDLDVPDLSYELGQLQKSNPALADQIARVTGQAGAGAVRADLSPHAPSTANPRGLPAPPKPLQITGPTP